MGLFRHGDMDTSEYSIRVFKDHVDKAGLTGKMKGLTVMELGPGDSISSAVIAFAHGARAILVDDGMFANPDVDLYFRLQRALKDAGMPAPNLDGCKTIAEILERCGAIYMTEGLKSIKQIDGESVDCIFSQAVLEHVRRHEFQAILAESRRVLRPGGVCTHVVDLSDHLSGGLNNLRFSNKVWESDFFCKSGFYTNRIRFGAMADIFSKAGYLATFKNIERWEKIPTPKKYFDREFEGITDADLCVRCFEVLLVKDGNPDAENNSI